MERSQEISTARGGGAATTLEGAVPPSNYNEKKHENVEEGGTAAIVEGSNPRSNSNENEHSEEGSGWTDLNRAVLK